MNNIHFSYKKYIYIFSIFLIGILLFASCESANSPVNVSNTDSNDQGAYLGKTSAPGTQYVPGEILVKFKSGTIQTYKDNAVNRIHGKESEFIYTKTMEKFGDKEGLHRISFSNGSLFQKIDSLKSLPEVEYAEPNYIYTTQVVSNDLYYTNGSLWGMYGSSTTPVNQYGSQAAKAWANGHTGSKSVYVGVIDEGCMYTHEDLSGQIWTNPFDPVDKKDNDGNGYIDDVHGWNFVSNSNTTYDGAQDDHGTHVSGTIGAIGGNGKGVVGVNWNITIITAKFLGTSGGTTANAVKAVDYITKLKTLDGLNIVATNNSWGGGGYSQSLYDAINRANSANILFVAAAGNNSSNNDATPSYPASYNLPNVIAVAALASNGTIASFSNYGATTVHLAAPGVGVYSTVPSSNGKSSAYASYSGTSMATPHVTGAAALYASTHPGATAAQIKSAILSSVISTPSLVGKCSTGGRLNLSGF